MSISRRTLLKQTALTAGFAMSGLPARSSAKETPPKCPTEKDTFALLRTGRKQKIPVIFDTDIGGDIDDTWALVMLLKCPELDVKLVASDGGNATYRARLAAKLLEDCGRTDIPVAVGIPPGDSRGHQSDWIGEYSLDKYPGAVYKDGVDAIVRTIKQSPEPVTVCCIGAVPNIAAALKRDPSIVENARFVGMHGSIRVGYDGSPKPCREANVIQGIAALRDVFAAPWECTITPLDTCGLVKLSGAKYEKIYQRAEKDPAIKALMENYRIWLPHPPWLKHRPDPAKESTTLFDLVAVYLAFSEDFVELEDLPIGVTDRGMTVIDKSKRTIRCATKWKDMGAFEDLLVERFVRN